MALRARVDRHRCIGAGTCITIAPTAFDWHEGDFSKAGVVDPASVEDELLREAALACPTGAITVEEVEELLPWQLRGKEAPRRVEKTFMFTDIEGSTNLVEALGDEARLSPEVFAALHARGVSFRQDKAFFDWAAAQGLDRKKVEDMYNSFAIAGKVNRARAAAQAYQIQAVPTVVVDGKFVTATDKVGTHAALPPAINALVAKARTERPKS